MDIFEKLFATSIQKSEMEFVREFPGPFLLRRRGENEQGTLNEESGAHRLREGSGARRLAKQEVLVNEVSLSFQRPQISPTGELTLPEAPEPPKVLFSCYAVEKTGRNVFANGITIGRTSNNDIVIPLQSISKFHAWIKKEAGSYILYDAINSQGTFVGTQKVSPNGEQGIFLRNGATIKLGDNEMMFIDATNLYRWFQTEFAG
jgi:hypothetical protein